MFLVGDRRSLGCRGSDTVATCASLASRRLPEAQRDANSRLSLARDEAKALCRVTRRCITAGCRMESPVFAVAEPPGFAGASRWERPLVGRYEGVEARRGQSPDYQSWWWCVCGWIRHARLCHCWGWASMMSIYRARDRQACLLSFFSPFVLLLSGYVASCIRFSRVCFVSSWAPRLLHQQRYCTTPWYHVWCVETASGASGLPRPRLLLLRSVCLHLLSISLFAVSISFISSSISLSPLASSTLSPAPCTCPGSTCCASYEPLSWPSPPGRPLVGHHRPSSFAAPRAVLATRTRLRSTR